MINKDLREEQAAVWILSEDKSDLQEVDYDTISLGRYFAVLLQTGSYTIMKKTENFDDEVIKISENFQNSLQFLQKIID